MLTHHKALGLGVRVQKAGSGLTEATAKLQSAYKAIATYGNEEISIDGSEFQVTKSEQLKRLKTNDQPFGGVDMFLVGDPLQKNPVKQASLFGPPTLTLKQYKYGKGNSQENVNRANLGRKMMWQSLDQGAVVVLEEDVRAKGDRVLRGVQRRVRYGKKVTELDHRLLLSRQLDHIAKRGEDVRPFLDPENAVLAGYRHTVLDAHNARTAAPLARKLGSKLLRVMADDRLAPPPPPKGERAAKVSFEQLTPIPDWLREFIRERPGSFTQTKTGKIASDLPLILGATYMIWRTPSDSGGNIGHLGGCNGALAKLVGVILSPGELHVKHGDTLRGAGEVDLSSTPAMLLFELEIKSMLKGQRIGTLPFGVVPLYPSTTSFEFDMSVIDDRFWKTAARLAGCKANDAKMRVRRKGFAIRLAQSFTDFMIGRCLAHQSLLYSATAFALLIPLLRHF